MTHLRTTQKCSRKRKPIDAEELMRLISKSFPWVVPKSMRFRVYVYESPALYTHSAQLKPIYIYMLW